MISWSISGQISLFMSEPESEPSGPPTGSTADRLDSWKEIAAYLGRGVTTVQRWEQEDGLPVHRLPHAKKGSVFAYRHQIDDWLDSRARLGGPTPVPVSPSAEPDRPPSATATVATPTRRPTWTWLAVAVIFVISAAGAFYWLRTSASAGTAAGPGTASSRPGPLVPQPLLASTDTERSPSLSPDGRQLAFAWAKEVGTGVYVKPMPDGEPRLLWPYVRGTNGVFITKWSPDNTRIAFNNLEGEDTYGLYVIPPDGGPADRLTSMAGVGICWTPDSRSLTFADRTSKTEPFSLYTIDIASRERRRVTTPPAGSFGDTACAWSLDGTRLAYARYATRFDSEVFILGHEPGAVPIRLTVGNGGIADLEWSPDGAAIVVADHQGIKSVAADGSTGLTLYPGLDDDAARLSFSRPAPPARPALVYSTARDLWHTWIWRRADAGGTRRWHPNDSFASEFPALTRDGTGVAFVTRRQIWTANVDGTDQRQLTFHGTTAPGRVVNGPAWSPDGRQVAFSVPVADHRDIYVIDRDGSNSVRLTSEPSLEDNPAWSNDGRWIYFRSDRGGVNHIWKIAAVGGPAIQVTSGEGWQAAESFDGTHLYFVRGTSQPGLWAMPVGGGAEELILPDVMGSQWAVADRGIYFVTPPKISPAQVKLLPRGASAPIAITTLPEPASGGFAVSADGGTVLWTRARRASHDIMLVSPWTR